MGATVRDKKRLNVLLDKICYFDYSYYELLNELDDEEVELLKYYYEFIYVDNRYLDNKDEVLQAVIKDIIMKDLGSYYLIVSEIRDRLYNYVKEFEK